MRTEERSAWKTKKDRWGKQLCRIDQDREEIGERTERFSGTKEKEESKKYKYGGKKGEGNNQQVGVSLW